MARNRQPIVPRTRVTVGFHDDDITFSVCRDGSLAGLGAALRQLLQRKLTRPFARLYALERGGRGLQGLFHRG